MALSLRVIEYAYVVFCRLVGIKDLKAQQLARAAGILDNEVCSRTAAIKDAECHSSVYGAFAALPDRVMSAVRLARGIRTSCAERGIALAIGVNHGRVEHANDFEQTNLVGPAINYAARLAFLPESDGRIAISGRTARDAIETGELGGDELTALLAWRVKRTDVEYHWYRAPLEELPPQNTDAKAGDPATGDTMKANVAVFDIEGFSGEAGREQYAKMESLRRAVTASLQSVALDDDARRWYAPAGDGGVMVAGGGRGQALWGFATKLAHRAYEEGVRLRIGVDSGQIVVLPDRRPVGPAILRADALCALPAAGEICVGTELWNDVLQAEDRAGWVMKEKVEDAVIVVPGHGEGLTKPLSGIEIGQMNISRGNHNVFIGRK